MTKKVRVLTKILAILAAIAFVFFVSRTAHALTAEEAAKLAQQNPALAAQVQQNPALLQDLLKKQTTKAVTPSGDKNTEIHETPVVKQAISSDVKPEDVQSSLLEEVPDKQNVFGAYLTVGELLDVRVYSVNKTKFNAKTDGTDGIDLLSEATASDLVIHDIVQIKDHNTLQIPSVGEFYHAGKPFTQVLAEIHATARTQNRRIVVNRLKTSGYRETVTDKSVDTDGDKELTVFGSQVFSQSASGGVVDQNIIVSEDYVLGAGDALTVTFWGRINKSESVIIGRDGTVFLSELGKIKIGGLQYGNAKKMVSEIIGGISGVKGDLTVDTTRTIRVMVLGEVLVPGFHTIANMASVTSAIMTAGGITTEAGIRGVEVKRAGKTVVTIDFYDLLLKGDVSKNIILQPGDVIHIPKAQSQVKISGAVRTPGIYEIMPGDTVEHVLRQIGGMKATAYGNKIMIRRFVGNNYSRVIDVAVGSEAFRTTKLHNGDEIAIVENQLPSKDSVQLIGNVYFSGEYAIGENTRVLDIIGSSANLKPETALSYAYIKRYVGDGKQTTIHSFDLGEALSDPQGIHNLLLHPHDEIYVMHTDDVSPKKIITIEGEVARPGVYDMHSSMTIHDLLHLSGGLTADADRMSIEIVRKEDNKISTYFVGEQQFNQYSVVEGDHVVVHSIWETRPKHFVEVTGEVMKPDYYLLTEGLTVSGLVRKAGGVSRNVFMDISHIMRQNPDGSTKLFSLDLGKALAGDPLHDIMLVDRDKVVVHNVTMNEKKRNITIQGAIKSSGEFPFFENMTLHDAIILAGNISDDAYSSVAEIVRMVVFEGMVDHDIMMVNLSDTEAARSFVLEPYDSINIKRIKGYGETQAVEITGEVRFPGQYAFRAGERLSDILLRAGGVTDMAYLNGIIFRRESARIAEQQQLDSLRQRLETMLLSTSSANISGSLDAQDISAQQALSGTLDSLVKQLAAVKAEGRVILNVKTLNDLIGTSYNFVLEDGDEIILPQKPSTISVVGEVYRPSSYIAIAGSTTVEDVIDSSGGMTELANEDLIYVVKANGSVYSNSYVEKKFWFTNIYDMELEVGDTVVVPRQLRFPSYMKDVKDLTQILYQIATTFAVTKVAF